MLQRLLSVIVPLLLLATAPVAWSAQTAEVRSNDLSYSYADFGYEFREYDTRGGDLEADSLFARGSYALDEHFAVRGGLSLFSGDNNYDGQRLSVGLGFNTPLKNRLDLAVSGDLVHDNNDIDNENGLIVKGGVRHNTTTSVELAGGLFYEDILPDLDDLGVYGRSMFHVDNQLDVGGGLRVGGDLFTLELFGRYHF